MLAFLLAIFVALLPKKKKPKLFCASKVKLVKHSFLFCKNLVFLNDKNVYFYAEFGGRFFIIFDKNARIEFEVKSGSTMHIFNANTRFMHANYSQNTSAYYRVDQVHSTASGQDFCLKISIEGCDYLWVPSTSTLKLTKNNQTYALRLLNVGTPKSDGHKLFFYTSNFEINYASFGFKLPTTIQKQEFLRKNFGFWDTKTWQNKQEFFMTFLDKDSLQKRYFLECLKEESKRLTNLFEIDYFAFKTQELKSFFTLTAGNKIKLDISCLCNGEVIDLQVHKTYVCVCYLETGYKFYLKFGKKIEQAFLGKVFSKLYLFVWLQSVCTLEFLPFCLSFDTNLLSLKAITCVMVRTGPALMFLNDNQLLSLPNIIDKLNNQVVSCGNTQCTKFLSSLYLQNLDASTQFKVANIILSKCLVGGEKTLLQHTRRFVLSPLKNLEKFKKSEVFCYLKKLQQIIKNQHLQKFLDNVLPQFEVADFKNFEYVFCHIFGINVVDNRLYVLNPKITFYLELTLNGKKVVLKSGKRNSVTVDGIEYVGKKCIDLFSSSKLCVLESSINN